MIFLGCFLIFELFVALALIGGQMHAENYFPVRFDVPSAVVVFGGVLLHVLIFGRKQFRIGLSALRRLPQSGDTEVAAYFRRLTTFTLLVGLVGMAFAMSVGIPLVRNPDNIGVPIAASLLTFAYAAWLAVMLFWPIAVRFSTEPAAVPGTPHRFWVPLVLIGLAACVLVRGLMAMVMLSLTTWQDNLVTLQPGDIALLVQWTAFSSNPTGVHFDWLSQLLWDVPSFLLILLSLGAFRLAAGKLKNRFEWIPVCILFGVLWTMDDLVSILTDVDPDLYPIGYSVALLAALYGLIAAAFFAVGGVRNTVELHEPRQSV